MAQGRVVRHVFPPGLGEAGVRGVEAARDATTERHDGQSIVRTQRRQ